jgi:hypothetical protein
MVSSVYDTMQQYRITTVGPTISPTGWSPIAWSTQHASLAVPSSCQSMILDEDAKFVYGDWSFDQKTVVSSVIERKFQTKFVPSVVTMASPWRDVKRSQIPRTRGQSREIRRDTKLTPRSGPSRDNNRSSLCNLNGYHGARNCPPLDISHMTSHTRSTL